MIYDVEYVYYAYACVGVLCAGSLLLGLYLTRTKNSPLSEESFPVLATVSIVNSSAHDHNT